MRPMTWHRTIQTTALLLLASVAAALAATEAPEACREGTGVAT